MKKQNRKPSEPDPHRSIQARVNFAEDNSFTSCKTPALVKKEEGSKCTKFLNPMKMAN